MPALIRLYGQVKSCAVQLTPSKSISNRVLIINSLCSNKFEVENLSNSNDTKVLSEILFAEQNNINVKDAGTAFRFLTSYLTNMEGEFFLTGTSRMLKRPIGPLVDTLNSLGASIEYTGENGFPPLRINGRKLIGGKARIDRSQSSQFVSSLLMVAPYFKNGLELELVGKENSQSYLDLTIGLMKYFGVEVKRTSAVLLVSPAEYVPKNIEVENDWSSASYWYLLSALNSGSKYFLTGLRKDSLQGDSVIVDLFRKFGVESEFKNGGVEITSSACSIDKFEFNFSSQPDLVMTFAVLCAAKQVECKFTGVENLRIKESDRLEALKIVLEKFNVKTEVNSDEFIVHRTDSMKEPSIVETFNDHRMAMAFAPLASLFGKLKIDDPDVVSKSYPEYWEQMSKAGIELEQIS